MLSSKSGDEQTLKWVAEGGTTADYAPPKYTTAAGANAKLRSTNTYKGKAVISDVCEDLRLINGVHKNGVNVLYANYGVKWIPLEMFKKEYYDSSGGFIVQITASPAANWVYDDSSAQRWFALGRIWENWDRQQ